jgi:hypothetical protein
MELSAFEEFLNEADHYGALDKSEYKCKFDLIAGLPKFSQG